MATSKSKSAAEQERVDPDAPAVVVINGRETTWVEHVNRGGVPPE